MDLTAEPLGRKQAQTSDPLADDLARLGKAKDLHMRVMGVLDKDGWDSMADGSFDPIEHGDDDNEDLPRPASDQQPDSDLRSADNPDRDRRSQRDDHASGNGSKLASVSDKRRDSNPEIEIADAPVQQGTEIIADDLLSSDAQLWRLEKYADRHGNTRVRRALRFVSGKPPRIELGKITGELSAQLESRTGKGRWKKSRVDAESFRLLAWATAQRLNRAKGEGRNRGKNVQHVEQPSDRIDGSAGLSDPQDFARWTVSNLRM